MRGSRCYAWSSLILVLTTASLARGQASASVNEADIGFVYPAGGQVGTEFEIVLGGQNLRGASGLYVSGGGVTAEILKHHRVFSRGESNRYRNQLDIARQELEKRDDEGNLIGKRAPEADVQQLAIEKGLVTEEDIEAYREYVERSRDPKRQENPQLEEWVRIRVQIAADAELGKRFIRLRTNVGFSNPLGFYLDQYPEFREQEPNDTQVEKAVESEMPFVLNGQIMPGDVDRFRFQAKKNDRLVVCTKARDLIPYLADAVPGWFQATLTLYDENGHEVAFADDYLFDPDPVLFFKIPRDGAYELEIRDSIYRGREDFVYRITVGEIPFLTSVYPLGRQSGVPTTVDVYGWNLPVRSIELGSDEQEPGVHPISLRSRRWLSNSVPFAVDLLPDCRDQEPNNDAQTAQPLRPPIIVNGRIDEPGDWDVFQFTGRAGGKVILEVQARRLSSPLDSYLKVVAPSGAQVAVNDDHVDQGAGLTTHHADSFLLIDLPEDGTYYVYLGDTQDKGGIPYVYRLRISARQPDFALRAEPSSLNVRPGLSVPFTVHALRHDDFDGPIRIELVDPPPGLTLRGGPIQPGKDDVELTLGVPRDATETPMNVQLVGIAEIKGREVRRSIQPADDWMQAFIYHHLVCTDQLVVLPTPKAVRKKTRTQLAAESGGDVVSIPAGGLARWQVELPKYKPEEIEQLKLEVVQPGQGITIERVVAGLRGVVLLLRADAGVLKPGDEGDLVIEAALESRKPPRTAPATDAKKTATAETLPPVIYRITGG